MTNVRDVGLIIGGEEQPSESGASFDVVAPASGELLGRAGRAGSGDVSRAVTAARAGYPEWAGLSPSARERILLQAAELLDQQQASELLDLVIDESGSTITKARLEITYAADLFRAAAGEVRRLYGDTLPNDRADRISMVFREPLGVVAIVSPYNAPLVLLAKMTAFPLAAGNSVVIKPSEETPLTALALGRILIEAGVPPLAVSVLPGFGTECGSPLVAHPDIDGIAFTGSTDTGIAIGQQAMQNMHRVQLELGGKSAILVLRDVDVEHAADVVAAGMFNHAGQICMANSRIIVERCIADAFSSALKNACENLKLGDLRDADTAYGPLINQSALDKVEAHQAAALEAGATLLTGGEVHEGLIYQPTVVVEPPRDCVIWCDESFGPLASLVAVDDLTEAIATANDSAFGLSAAVLTQNVKWAFRAAREIRAGSVHIGMHAFQSNAMAPIGGYGMSGLGRSGGQYSTEEFTQLKWVSVELDGD